MLTLDDLWRLELSAKDFTEFVGASRSATNESLETGPAAYVIIYRNSHHGSEPGLVSATLTIDRVDIRPIEQRFHLRYGSDVRVLRFVEKSFGSRPLSGVSEQVFEIDPELRGATPGDSTAIGGAAAADNQQTSSPAAPAPLAATAELEIKALTLLHQTGADLGEEVSLTRGAKEARRRKSSETPATTPQEIEEFAAARATIPAQSELRAYFTRKLAGGSQPESRHGGSKAGRPGFFPNLSSIGDHVSERRCDRREGGSHHRR